MTDFIFVCEQQDFQGSLPQGMAPFLVRIFSAASDAEFSQDPAPQSGQQSTMGIFAPADLLVSSSDEQDHALRIASFVALHVVRTIKQKDFADEFSLAAAFRIFDMELNNSFSSTNHLLAFRCEDFSRSMPWPRQYNIIELATRAQTEVRKLSLERVSCSVRPSAAKSPSRPPKL